MKSILTALILFMSLSVFSQIDKSSLIQFKKEYNALEYDMKTKTEVLNHNTTLKISKMNYDSKQELNELEAKYGSNKLKPALYQKKYQKEVVQVQNKYQVLLGEIQSNHQIEMSKIQSDFEIKKSKLQLKYQIGAN